MADETKQDDWLKVKPIHGNSRELLAMDAQGILWVYDLVERKTHRAKPVEGGREIVVIIPQSEFMLEHADGKRTIVLHEYRMGDEVIYAAQDMIGERVWTHHATPWTIPGEVR